MRRFIAAFLLSYTARLDAPRTAKGDAVGGDISVGLITGGAASGLSKAGIYGRYASYAVRGNTTEFGRGISNASVNGLTWQNFLQMAGAGLGTMADYADLAPSIRGIGNGVAPAKTGTFVDQMTPAEAARYRDYWGGYSEYQRDTSGMAPFGTKTAFTEAGDVKTVTTFDQYGRPHLQYGVNEGEPFHQHGFEIPTYSKPGTGWAPVIQKGVPVQ